MRVTGKRNLGFVLLTAFTLTLISLCLFHNRIKQYGVFTQIGFHSIESASETQHIDSENALNFDRKLERELPHLPVAYLRQKQSFERSYKKNCAVLPTLFDLNINNVYWQHLVTKNFRNFYLYGAYYDDRSLTKGLSRIRLLGMVDQIPPPKTHCQFWYENETKPQFSLNASTYHHIWMNEWGNGRNGTLHPVLITCILPLKERRVPVVVSLVEEVCNNARNALRIFNDPKPQSIKENPQQTKPSIAVCVKGLNYLYEDRSVRLVEWFELLRILGADKVFMYEMSVHPTISKVLRYYQRDGLVNVRDLTLPGDQLNQDDLRVLYLSRKIIHKRQNELIPYNDCLYRSIRRYDYVVLLDTDEVIVPTKVDNWQQLIRKNVNDTTREAGASIPSTYSSLCAVNVHFYDDYLDSDPNEAFSEVPKYLHMLNQIHRMANFSKPGLATKCFHTTDRVLTLHNHYPMSCGLKKCRAKNIPKEEGRMHHYRNRNRTLKPNKFYKIYLNETVVDKTVWKFKEKLVERSNFVLRELGLH